MRLMPVLLAGLLSSGGALAQQAAEQPAGPAPAPSEAPAAQPPGISTEASEPTITRPPWRPARGIPDVTMLVSRQAPLATQAIVLMVLDFSLPIAVAVPGAIVGAAVGGLLGSFELPFSSVGVPRPITNPGAQVVLGAMLGALVGGTLSMLGADVALNTFHLQKLAPSRIITTAVMSVSVVMAALLVGAMSLSMFPVPAAVVAVLGAFSVWACCMGACFLPPLALVAGMGVRMTTDYVNGSALWEETPEN